MDQIDNFFKTVAQASSTVRHDNDCTRSIKEILNNIEQETLDFINTDGASLRRSELLRRLKTAMTEARLQVSFPFLIDHSTLMLLGISTGDCFRILGQVMANTQQSVLDLGGFSLPVMIYHDDDSTPMVYNRMSNAVSMAPEELQEFLNLGRNAPSAAADTEAAANATEAMAQPQVTAQSRHIANMCTIPMKFRTEYQNICLIFVQPQHLINNNLQPELFNICHGVIYSADSLNEKTTKLLYSLPLKLLNLTSGRDKASDSATSSYHILNNETIACKDLTIEQLISTLPDYNRSCYNLTLGQQIKNICCEINARAMKELKRCEHNITNLNKFIVETSETQTITDEVGNRIEGIRNILTQEETHKTRLMERIQRADALQQNIFAEQNQINELLTKMGLTIDQNLQYWSSGSIAIWRKLFLAAADSNDISLATKSLSLRNKGADPLVKIEEYFLKTSSMTEAEFDQLCPDINNITLKHIFIQHVQQDKKNSSLQQRKEKLALSIPEHLRTGTEHYLAGSALFDSDDIGLDSAAIQELEKSVAMGENAAISLLVNIYKNSLADENTQAIALQKLHNLADTMYPEAAFTYGEEMSKRHRPNLAMRYIRNAASQQYEPAIESYARLLWQDVKHFENLENSQKQLRARHAVIVNKYLFRQKKTPEYANRIGILLYRLDNKLEAFNFLKEAADASMPHAAYLMGKIYYLGETVAKDKEKAGFYLNKSDLPEAKKLLEQIEQDKQAEAQKQEQQQKQGSSTYSADKDYSSHSSSSSSSSCFITTATCESEGKPDDCDELTMFRRFRDEILLPTKAGQLLVSEYYRIAPTIVQRIKDGADSHEVFNHIYHEYITPAYSFLQHKNYEKARELYIDCVKMLAALYDVEIHDPNITDSDFEPESLEPATSTKTMATAVCSANAATADAPDKVKHQESFQEF